MLSFPHTTAIVWLQKTWNIVVYTTFISLVEVVVYYKMSMCTKEKDELNNLIVFYGKITAFRFGSAWGWVKKIKIIQLYDGRLYFYISASIKNSWIQTMWNWCKVPKHLIHYQCSMITKRRHQQIRLAPVRWQIEPHQSQTFICSEVFSLHPEGWQCCYAG